MMKGRVFVPVRILSEALGAEVDWDANNRSVFITKSSVSRVAKSQSEMIDLQSSNDIQVYVNGYKIHSDVSPQMIDNQVVVPVRWVAIALGAHVKWDADNQIVTVKELPYPEKMKLIYTDIQLQKIEKLERIPESWKEIEQRSINFLVTEDFSVVYYEDEKTMPSLIHGVLQIDEELYVL